MAVNASMLTLNVGFQRVHLSRDAAITTTVSTTFRIVISPLLSLDAVTGKSRRTKHVMESRLQSVVELGNIATAYRSGQDRFR